MSRRHGVSMSSLSIALAGAVLLVLVMGACRHHLLAADLALQPLLRGRHWPALKPLMQSLSLLGSGGGVAAMTIGLGLLLWRRRHPLAAWLPAMVAGSIVVTALSKWLLGGVRPGGGTFGFPSGHVLTAVVLFGFVAHLIRHAAASRGWRLAGVGACLALIAGIAYSRLYLNAHWFSDVLGGLSGGSVLFLAALRPRP